MLSPEGWPCAAVDYLESLRWPQGFVGPVCGGESAWRTRKGLWMCTACQRKASVTAGTIFHRSLGQPLGLKIRGHRLPTLNSCRCLCFAKRLQYHVRNLLYLGLIEQGQVATLETVHCQHALVEVAPAQRF